MPPIDEVPRGNKEGEGCGRSGREKGTIHHCQVALKALLKTQASLSECVEWRLRICNFTFLGEKSPISFCSAYNLISLLFPQTVRNEMSPIY